MMAIRLVLEHWNSIAVMVFVVTCCVLGVASFFLPPPGWGSRVLNSIGGFILGPCGATIVALTTAWCFVTALIEAWPFLVTVAA